MKKRLMGSVMVVLAFTGVLLAQNARRQPGAKAGPAPRTPDGKPDLSGVWVGGGSGGGGWTEPLELTKWGTEKFTWNNGPESANAPKVYGGQKVRVEYDPVYHCYPLGLARLGPPPNDIGSSYSAAEILQTPGKVIIVYQQRNSVRHIYTDGRGHPKNVELTWNGHSIGRWDGDTLVVDTVGLRDESWLDSGGHEHSPELHVVERFRRVDANSLELEKTLTDPVALAKPFVKRDVLRLDANYDLNDNMDGKQYDCSQFMVRKPAFGEGENGLLGISEHP